MTTRQLSPKRRDRDLADALKIIDDFCLLTTLLEGGVKCHGRTLRRRAYALMERHGLPIPDPVKQAEPSK